MRASVRKVLEKMVISLSPDYYKDIIPAPITKEKIRKAVQELTNDDLMEWVFFVTQSPSTQIEVIEKEIQYGNSKPASNDEEALNNFLKDNFEVKPIEKERPKHITQLMDRLPRSQRLFNRF